MAPLAVLLLLHMPEEAAFWTFAAAYEDHLPHLVSATREAQPGFSAVSEYIAESLQLVCPELVEHLEFHSDPELSQLGQLVDRIAFPMVLRLSCEALGTDDTLGPYPTLRILDLFFCEGPGVILAAALVTLLICKDAIFAATSAEDLMMVTQTLQAKVKEEFESRIHTDLIEMIMSVMAKVGNKEVTLKQGLVAAKAKLLEADDEAVIQTLTLRVEWITERLGAHAELQQQSGSLATCSTEILEDWNSLVQAHTARCLWRQV